MSLSSDIIRGHTDTVILARLAEADSYGYEISKAVLELSGGSFEFKEGTLYTAFRRLEQGGFISSYWGDEATGGARRRYYSITESGRQLLAESRAEWERTKHVIDSLVHAALPAANDN